MESIPIRIPDNPNDLQEQEECLGLTPPDAEIITTLDEGVSLDPPPKKKSKVRVYSTLPSSSYSSLMPYQIPQVKEILRTCFPNPLPQDRIIDATAHIGGDSILFSEVFPDANIIAIDVDPAAIECLKRNIVNFANVLRFEVICANSVEWIRTQPASKNDPRKGDALFYYFDPPWGGPQYYIKKEVNLCLDGQPIADIINTVFSMGLSKKILLKVPRNFAYPAFKASVQGSCKLFYIKKPQKNGSIAYGLVLVTNDR